MGLLIKHRNEAADAHSDIEKHGRSVLTGRSMDEIRDSQPAGQLAEDDLRDSPISARRRTPATAPGEL